MVSEDSKSLLCWLMGLDMSDFRDASTYKSLNELFTRKLREDRTYSLDGDDCIHP